MDVRLKVVDSSNSAGVMIDSICLTKLALDRKIGGDLYYSASAYLAKHPPKQFCDDRAGEIVEEHIRKKKNEGSSSCRWAWDKIREAHGQ